MHLHERICKWMLGTGPESDVVISSRVRLARNAAGLTEVEQAVVAARFALAGQRRPRTLQEVSELVGLSKERVRQVQIESLCKIRDAFEKHTAA